MSATLSSTNPASWQDFPRVFLRGLRGTLPYDRPWHVTEDGRLVMIEHEDVAGPWPPEKERPATEDERRAIIGLIQAAVAKL